MAITKFNVVEGLTVGDLVQIPVIDNTANVSANNLTVQGDSNLGNLATANYFTGNGRLLTGITLANTIADVSITSPTLGQTLAYNGLVWVNTTTGSVSAGQGVDFFFTGPQIIAQTSNNYFELDSLSSSPNATSTTISQAINNTTQVIAGGRSNVLNRTKIDGGAWDLSVYGNIDATTGTNSLQTAIFYIESPNCTFTVTGTGTTRTVTASTGSPFANITASATITSASFLETPTGVYQISAKTSNTIVTINTPNGYTNESTVSGYVYNPYILFDAKNIISTSMAEYVFSASAVEQAINTTDRLGFFIFGTTTTSRTLYVTLGGTTQGTHITTPFAVLHDELAGLQGGQANEYFHLTLNEYNGTGTGNFVRQSNASLITPNIDSATGLSLNLTGNIIAGNANLGNLVIANYITGTLTTGSQPNITSLGNLSSLTSNGTIDFINASNVSLGNVSNLKILGGSSGYVLKTDGTGNLSWGIDTTAAAGTNTQVQFNNSNNLGASANFTFDTSTSLLTVIGNINSENADLGNLVQANYFSGNGSLLGSITGGNVTGTVANANYATFAGTAYSVSGSNVSGQVANALIAGTVYTNAQPNITSVGTLSSLSVTANITAGNISATDAIFSGNLTVSGNTVYANVTTLNVKDPIIEMGGNPNGDPLTSNDGKDRGTLLHYYSNAAIDAFMGWDNSNSEFAFGSNVTNTNEIITFNELGNVRANYFLGNASQLTGTIANANYSTFAGTVTTNAQPNITSLGTLANLTVTGNVSSGNADLGNLVSANYFSGNGYFLSSINVSNIGTVANANYALYAGTVLTNAQPNITSVGNLSDLTVIGNITSGNASLGNLTTSNYFSGNGSLLTSLTGSNVTGQVGNALVAGTVYTNSQPNITSVGTLNGLTANSTIDFTNATNVTLGNVSNLHISGGSAGYVLKTDGTGNLSWGIDTTAAAGSNTQVQFNDGNSLGADANFIYNKATQVLDVLGTVAGYTIRPSIGSGANGIVFPNNPGGGAGDGASIKYYAYSGEDSVLEFTIANDANDYIKFNSPGGVVVDTNITANNANLGNLVTANYFSGNGSLLTSLTGSNVTGQVGNALISGTVYTNAQPNITSLGTLSNLNVTGNITSGNASLGNLVTANYFSGDGSLLTSITGANVTGTVPNANYSVFAGTVIANAQPNITSVGNLSALTVSGNATIAGNLTVSGTTIYANVSTLNVKDPIIELGGTGNNDPLSSNDGKDRGTLLHYYTTSPVDAFMGWDNSNGEFAFGSNVTLTNEVATFNQFGNVRASYFLGNGSQLTGVIANANYSTFAGTVLTNAQPNITSLGTLTTLTVTGNITTGNATLGNLATANYFSGDGSLLTSITGANVTGFVPNANIANTAYSVSGSNVSGQVANALIAGTVYTNAQPNITSVGTLTTLTVSGNASFTGSNTYFSNISNVKIPGGSNGYVLKTDGTGNLSWGIDATDYSNTNVAAYLPTYTGNFTAGNISATGTIIGAAVTANYAMVTAQTTGVYYPTFVSSNTSGNYALGSDADFKFDASNNELQVANIVTGTGTGGSITGANLISANYFTGTLTTQAQPNVTSLGTLSSLSVTSNVSAGNVLTDNLLYANGVAWSFGSTYSNANVAAYLPTYTGNISANYFIGNGSTLTSLTGANVTGQVSNALIAGTVYTNAQPNITSLGTLSSVSVTGNVSAGNADLGNLAVANFYSGNGSLLTSITGVNVTGQVGNALVASTVYTNAQPNITSVGTLTGLTVSGNASFTGANTYFANVANIKIPGGSAGYVLKTDGTGNLSWGIDVSDYSNTNVAAYLPTYTGNLTAGNITGSNLISGNFLTGILTTAAQPNITSLGTLASLTVTANISSGNANLGNLAVANYFSGNGSLLTSITAGNINGQVSNALVAGTVYTNAQPNITSIGTLSSLTVTGLITATGTGIKLSNIQDSSGTVTIQTGYGNVSGDVGVYGNLTVGTSGTGNITAYNASLGNLANASYFSGNGSLLTSITGANVTGQVGNALVAGTVYTNAQPNITSLGTLSNLSVTANISVGNISATGTIIGTAVTANYVMTTSQTTGVYYPTFVSNNSSGNYALGTNANISFDAANSALNVPKIVSGTGNGGSITGANLISANYFQGDGSLLSNLNISNASVSNANYASFAGNVINSAQPNITSLGNLSSLTVTGNISAGNVLTDNLLYANGVAWGFGSTYSNTNVAAYLPTYTGNVSANYFIGNGSSLTDINGSNVTGQVANALIAGTVYTNAQPNITSVGNLSNLTVSGNATIAGDLTVSGNTVYANVTTLNVKDPIIELGGTGNNDPLTSNDGKDRGTLLHYYTTSPVDAFMGWDNSNSEFAFGSNVTNSSEVITFNSYGNIRANYIYGNGAFLTGLPEQYGNSNVANYLPTYTGNLTAGNITGANLISGNFLTGTLTTNAQPNITSLGTLSDLSVTGNVVAGNLTSNSLGNQQIAISLNGLLVGGPDLLWEFSNAALYAKNIKANGVSIINGNITSLNADLGNLATANYFTGNGSLLTSITGSNVTGQVGNALLAGTVYTNAQPNITSVGTLTSLDVTGNVSAGNIKSDNLLYANGTPYVFTTNAAGSNTQVQFNDGNLFAGSSAFTFDKSSNTLNVTNFTVSNITTSAIANLGDVSNVRIFGGSTGYLLATDGYGNLSWLNSSGGGGSGFVNIVKNSFTGNGVQTTFNLNTTPSSEEAVMVNIDGLLQQDSVYSISGAQLIFVTAPLSGVKIEVTIFGAVPITSLNTQVLYANGSNVVGSANFTFNNSTNTLSVTNISSSSNIAAGNLLTNNLLYANGTPYVFTTNAAGSNTQVQFNDGNSFAGSANFTFDKSSNTLSVTNIIGNGAGITYITGSNVNGQVGNALIAGTVYTNSQPNITSLGTLSSLSVTGNVVAGNLEATSGTATLGSGVISVSSGNAGIFASGISNINLGLSANVTIGSTTGNVVVQGRIGANLFYSNRAAIVVTTNTVIDSFTTTEYRSAKYTMRVNSDDGYQTAEVLLIHDGSNSYVTIYGTLSTIGTDIISLSSDINSGNVRLLATTGSPNTTVKVLGTYVAD